MKKIVVFCAVLLILSPAVFASVIVLDTNIIAQPKDGVLNVKVFAKNRGDESAFNVQTEVRAGGQKVMTEKKTDLGVDEVYQGQAVLNLSALQKPGTYPLEVIIHYTDANQYPFTSLNCRTFNYKSEPLPAQIWGIMYTANLWKEGSAALSLKNHGDKAIAGQGRLVVPRELSVGPGTFNFDIPPQAERKFDLKIKNFSALNGSTYLVFAVLEYEKDGFHQTSIIPAAVKIVESKQVAGIGYAPIIIILIVLIGFFAIAQFTRRKNVGA